MAKAWKDVIASPQYQALAPEQKAQAQEQYFNEVVAPQAGENAEQAKQAFYSAYPRGLLEKGNIDIHNRPVVKNSDGSISTVRSMSTNIDGREVLIPTVSDDGRIMSDDEAIDNFMRTGKHLGMFDNPDDATAYAESLHNQQADEYLPRKNQATQQPVQQSTQAAPQQQKEEPSLMQQAGDWLTGGQSAGQIAEQAGRGLVRQQLESSSGADIVMTGSAPFIVRSVGDILKDIPTNKYFGAKCDGVTDDTIANQTALDWSADNKRDVIFVGKSCITERLIHKSGSRVTHLGEIKPRDFSDDVVIEVKDDAWRDPYNDGITAIDTGDRVHIDGLYIAPDSVIDAVGILGTDGVDPIISRLRTFNMRRGGIKIVKGYGWNISNISIIAPFDQNNSHDYAGIRHETSDSFYSNVIVSGYTTGLDMPGNANQVSKAHCWGMSSPDRTTRNMLFGLKMSGSGNNVVQFYSDSPKKINKTQAASITNGGIGYVISGFNNTFLSPRNLSHQDCGLKYGKVFLISGSENTFISPLIGDYAYIEDDGFFTFTDSASPLNNYVYGGNMQSTYLYPIASGSYKPTVNIPCTYTNQSYTHNILQKNVIGRVVITCNITNNSSGDTFYIQLPPYLSTIAGSAVGSITNNLTTSIRSDTNLFAVEPYVADGRIYFRRIFRAGASDDIKQNMFNTGNAFFDISINAR